MENLKKLSDFLYSKGFVLQEKFKSDSFGDYYHTFTSSKFNLRFIRDKSSEDIDIYSIYDGFNNNQKPNRFYLPIIKSFIYNEENLAKNVSIEDQILFLKQEFDTITELFSKEKYPDTKVKLEILKKRRVSQIFPNLKWE